MWIVWRDNWLFAFLCYPLCTLRRSPLEQYSMVNRGKSFKAIELNSSGTSLAWTTFTWLSLGQKESQTHRNSWTGIKCVVKVLRIYLGKRWWFTLTSSWSESLCSSGLCSWSSTPGGRVSQQSSLQIPAHTHTHSCGIRVKQWHAVTMLACFNRF